MLIVRQVTYRSHKVLGPRLLRAMDVFEKYYSKIEKSPVYLLALILNPSQRSRYLKDNLKTKRLVDERLNICKSFWASWRESHACDNIPSSRAEKRPVEPKHLSEYGKIRAQLHAFQRPRSQDEFDDYLSQEQTDLGERTAIEWWFGSVQRHRFPHLSLLAIEILSIPAMSDEPERVFSGCRRTVSWERSQISPTELERMECLKHWMQRSVYLEDTESVGDIN
jgi:hypothetical protein